MSRSLLLHALSLNDRMLEPNQLPVSGHVWGYDKQQISREEFVGNCMSMLTLLGIRDAEISWDDEIMAFDVTRNGKPATVIISLQDDSLASEFFYFLGIWSCPHSGSASELELICSTLDWQEEDLLIPALTYSVRFSSEPMQLPEMRRMIEGELFTQHLYDGAFLVAGNTEAYPVPCGRFVIAPSASSGNHPRYEVRHALYSLRNLMGLMGGAMNLYDFIAEKHEATGVTQALMALMQRLEGEMPAADAWDDLVRENGSIALKVASEVNETRKLAARLKGIRRLFAVILAELASGEVSGISSLFERMQLPFEHVEDLLDEYEEMLAQAEKQTQILQPLMHSRMLAGQQQLLETLIKTQNGKE